MAQKPRVKGPVIVTDALPFVWPTLNAASDKFKENGEFNVKVRMAQDSDAFRAIEKKLAPLHEKAVAAAEVEFAALPVKARKELEKKGVKAPVVNGWFTEVYDDATEEPTGEVEMKFSVAATKGPFKSGKFAGKFGASRPTVIDSAKEVIIPGFEFKMCDTLAEAKALTFKPVGPRIWGGTVGRVKFEVKLNKDGEVGYWIPGTAACGISLTLLMVQVIELVQGGTSVDTDGFEKEEGYVRGGTEASEAEGEEAGADEDADF